MSGSTCDNRAAAKTKDELMSDESVSVSVDLSESQYSKLEELAGNEDTDGPPRKWTREEDRNRASRVH